MNLDEVLSAWFWLIDDLLPVATEHQRLRQAGPAPRLSDSEVITMEVIGMSLGGTRIPGCLPPFTVN